MKRPTLVITGTDTAVGKTVLTCLLARWLRERGRSVAALKPICSGGRDDARALRAATGGVLSLADTNPWHFRAPLAPLLAARRENRRVALERVLAHVRRIGRRFELTLVEGAGGLLSPLGEGFDTRHLIRGLRAVPVIVAPNRLGAVGQVRLVIAALPPAAARRSQVVLNAPRRPDAASRSNMELLREFIPVERIHLLPAIPDPSALESALRHPQVAGCLTALSRQLGVAAAG